MDTHHWQFYLSPAEAWQAMYEDCVAATRSIVLEQYIFANDEIGQKFMKLFVEKAKAGLQVHLLCDEVGSLSLRRSPLINELRTHGGHFRFYNSFKLIDLFKPRRLFPRTHLKVLVVDATVAYVGGVCIEQSMQHWRDTQIRITGPVVSHIYSISNANFDETSAPPPPSNVQTLDFTYIQSFPKFFRHPIYAALLHAISKAETYIYMSAAFFVPSRRLSRHLIRAALRGVNVMVLVPFHSRSHLADLATLSYARKLLKNGVRIFRYKPSILHNKTVVIDGNWGTVGSSNMDSLSFFHNREGNLFIKNVDALAEMEGDFLADLKNSDELTLEYLNSLPLWKRAAIHAARLCHSFL